MKFLKRNHSPISFSISCICPKAHFSIIFSRNFKWPHFEITCFNIKSRDNLKKNLENFDIAYFSIAHDDCNDIYDDANRRICIVYIA